MFLLQCINGKNVLDYKPIAYLLVGDDSRGKEKGRRKEVILWYKSVECKILLFVDTYIFYKNISITMLIHFPYGTNIYFYTYIHTV